MLRHRLGSVTPAGTSPRARGKCTPRLSVSSRALHTHTTTGSRVYQHVFRVATSRISEPVDWRDGRPRDGASASACPK